jgi:hypothetical protein
MASDGPVANIKMARHRYDDVIREFVKRVVDAKRDYFARACAAAVGDALSKTAAKGSRYLRGLGRPPLRTDVHLGNVG